MEYLNGLDFLRKTTIEWHEIELIIKHTLNCEYIFIDEVERVDTDILVQFKILDVSKRDEIKNSFKRFVLEEDLENIKVFDDIDIICDTSDYANAIYIKIDEDICLNIIESYLNTTYDINIEVKYLEACFKNLGVIFELKEKDKK